MEIIKTLSTKGNICHISTNDTHIKITVVDGDSYLLEISHLDKVLSYKQLSALVKYAEKNQIQETEQTLTDSDTLCPSQSEATKVAEGDTSSTEEKPFPSKTFRVIVAGSRTFTDYALLESYCDLMLSNKQDHEITIISGGAMGADDLARHYAWWHQYDLEIFEADWKKHGKKAGYIRNLEMAEHADALIAFDGGTKGIGHMIDIARAKRLPLRIKKV